MKADLEKDKRIKDSVVKDNETYSVSGKKKGKEERPPTKVVIRRLPPTMTEEMFLQQVAPLPPINYMYFVPADTSLAPYAYCRVYLNFINQEDIFIFTQKFDGYVFLDTKGLEYPAIVEFAPFQRIPKQRPGRRKDPKAGTIESDPAFLAFIENLNAQTEENLSSGNNIKQHFFETNVESNDEKKVSSTPLLDYLRNRHAERIRIREEKKKKDLERKRVRDEQRRNAKKMEEEGSVLKVIPNQYSSKEKNKDSKSNHSKKYSDERPKEYKGRIGKSYSDERQKYAEKREAQKKKYSSSYGSTKFTKLNKSPSDVKINESCTAEADKISNVDSKKNENRLKEKNPDLKKDEKRSTYFKDNEYYNRKHDDRKRYKSNERPYRSQRDQYYDRKEDKYNSKKKLLFDKKNNSKLDDKDKSKKDTVNTKEESNDSNSNDPNQNSDDFINKKVNSDSLSNCSSNNNLTEDVENKQDFSDITKFIVEATENTLDLEIDSNSKESKESNLISDKEILSECESILSEESYKLNECSSNLDLHKSINSSQLAEKLPEENIENNINDDNNGNGQIQDFSDLPFSVDPDNSEEINNKNIFVPINDNSSKSEEKNESCSSSDSNNDIKRDLLTDSEKVEEKILKRRNSMEDIRNENYDRNERKNVRRSSLESGDILVKFIRDEEKEENDKSSDIDKPKDPRTERRIRNKDRPTMEIYRPGMGKFSKQRLERGKTRGNSSEADSNSPSPSPTLGPKQKSTALQ